MLLAFSLAAVLSAGCGERALEARDADADAGEAEPAALLGPRLELAALSHDFGEVSDVHPLRHEFAFHNAGDQELVITDLSASCGCTAMTLEKREYAPGEGGTIGVKWDPKGHSRQSKTVTVLSNGTPDRVVLTVSATIRPFVQLEPSYLAFGRVQIGEERSMRAALGCSDPDFVVESVKCVHPHLAAQVVQDPDSGARIVEVRLLPTAGWGTLTGKVAIGVRGRLAPDQEPLEHVAELTVTAQVFGEMHLDRTLFAVGRVDPGASFRAEIRVSRASGAPFQITSARMESSTPPGMEVRAETFSERGASGYRLVVTGEAGGHLGLIRGQVLFETDIEGEPERRVPVMGIVRALEVHEH